MAELWVDVLTPKQALFTKAMLERAPSKISITVTTRDYLELNQFAAKINLPRIPIGKHGATLEGKLKASIERQRALVPFVSKHGFDLSLSFVSPEAARVSFGLALKHYIQSDSPHAEAACRLAVPLAAELFSPFPIARERWTQYGLTDSQVRTYHALDAWAWLLSRKIRVSKKRKRRVLVRLEEAFASYMKSGGGVSSALEGLLNAVSESGDYEIVLIPRYDSQRKWAKKKFGTRCTVPDEAVDGLDYIENSDLVIGGGGTMTQEAALVGVPNISYFPSARLDVFENYYFPEKLSAKASNPKELVQVTRELLLDIDSQKRDFADRAAHATKGFEDPALFILKNIRK